MAYKVGILPIKRGEKIALHIVKGINGVEEYVEEVKNMAEREIDCIKYSQERGRMLNVASCSSAATSKNVYNTMKK